MQLQGQHILILGLGASGLAMARWCAHQGAEVTVADTREQPPQLAALQAEWPAVRFVSGPFTAALVEGSSVRAVFRSPGLAPEVVAPVVDAARAMGLWQGGELSLFAQALQALQTEFGYAPQVLAITGTNGKTTVTSLTGQLVERAGKTVKVAGNIGPTLLDTLSQAIAQAEQEAPVLEQQEREAEEAEAARLAEQAAQALQAEAVAEVEAPEVEEPEVEASPVSSDEVVDPAAQHNEEEAQTAPVLQAPTRLPAMARVLPQVWVLELSSFQLDSSEGFEPTAATVLNVTQDHLDWHGTMAAYAKLPYYIFADPKVRNQRQIPHLQVVGSVRYSPLAIWHWEQEQSVIGQKAPTPPARKHDRSSAPTTALKAPRWYEINQASAEVTKSDSGDAHITRHCPALPSASGDFPHTFQHPISKELQ